MKIKEVKVHRLKVFGVKVFLLAAIGLITAFVVGCSGDGKDKD